MDASFDTNMTHVPEEVWHDWRKVCSEFGKYFEKQKEIRRKKENCLKHTRPVYRDSHSIRY